MVKLNYGIGDGDVEVESFEDISGLIDFVSNFTMFEGVWIVCTDADNYAEEILITETLPTIIKAIQCGFFYIDDWHDRELFIFHEESYESAYAVALDMREPNPKCYDE